MNMLNVWKIAHELVLDYAGSVNITLKGCVKEHKSYLYKLKFTEQPLSRLQLCQCSDDCCRNYVTLSDTHLQVWLVDEVWPRMTSVSLLGPSLGWILYLQAKSLKQGLSWAVQH